jgi:3-dehydroquinate synthase
LGRVTVMVSGRPYPVLVGQGALQEIGPILRELGVAQAAIVTDHNVGRLWGETVEQALSGHGIPAGTLSVAAGEVAKSFDQLRRVLAFLEDRRIDRQDAVVALGGGVVGDLAGFAASIWLRGVRVVQVPTTLLAMVDSAIGGKTGIDTERTKNGVGSFWQPAAVIADLATLGTLPEEDYLGDFGEVVKYGVAMDAQLARDLLASRERLLTRHPEALEPIVERCVAAKGRVVAADEREGGPRQILNYGHTVGHGIEVATGYRAPHGRAIAQGMRAAARIGARAGYCDEGLVAEQEELLRAFGLPGRLPAYDPEAVLAALSRDKKARAGAVQWVMPRELGRAEVGKRVADEVVREVVLGLDQPLD